MHLTSKKTANKTNYAATTLVADLDGTETIVIAVPSGTTPAYLRAVLAAGRGWVDMDHRNHPARFGLNDTDVVQQYDMHLTSMDMQEGAVWTLHGTVQVSNPAAASDATLMPWSVQRRVFSFSEVQVVHPGQRPA